MSKVIEIDELSKFLQQDFLDYAGEVNKIVESECKEMANKLKTELSNDSSIPQSTSRQKHYKKSFAIKKGKDGEYTIYNKKYRLTHLLENGHDIYANGVNTGKRTRAFPHWKQANDKAQGLVAEIKKRLEANK